MNETKYTSAHSWRVRTSRMMSFHPSPVAMRKSVMYDMANVPKLACGLMASYSYPLSSPRVGRSEK